MTALGESRDRRAARRWPPVGPVFMACVLVGVMGFVMYETFGYTIIRMRFSPLVFGTATGVLALLVLVAELRAFRISKQRLADPATSGAPAPAEDPTAEAPDLYLVLDEIKAIGWFFLLVATFLSLGFIIGMSLFMIVFLKVYGREGWVTTLVITVAVMTVIYLLFIEFLGVRVYSGALDIPLPFGL